MCRLSCITLAAIVAAAGSIAFTQPPAKDPKAAKPAAPAQPANKDAKPAGQPEMSEQDQKDMQCMMEAATPGEMHKWLAKGVGTWTGKNKMWMKEGAPPIESECTDTVTAIMDGRFIKCEFGGDMMGMPFKGGSVTGYDNTSKKFQSTWIDNMGTGMMIGTGELSSDQKTLTWKFEYTCPIAKKVVVMRQIEKHTSDNAFTLEMWGPDPHTGKEFKCMEIAFTRKAAAANAAN